MKVIFAYKSYICTLTKCDTMWVVRQADDPFVCFGAKPNKGLGLEISDETGNGGVRGPREARKGELVKEPKEGELAKEPGEGQLVKRDAERQSRTGAEGTSQDELAVQCWTVSRRRQ